MQFSRKKWVCSWVIVFNYFYILCGNLISATDNPNYEPSKLIELLDAKRLAITNFSVNYTFTQRCLEDADSFIMDFNDLMAIQDGLPPTNSIPPLPKNRIEKQVEYIYRQEDDSYYLKTSNKIPNTTAYEFASDGRLHVWFDMQDLKACISNTSFIDSYSPQYKDFILDTIQPHPVYVQGFITFLKNSLKFNLLQIVQANEKTHIVRALLPRKGLDNFFDGYKITINLEKGGLINHAEAFASRMENGVFEDTPPFWVMNVDSTMEAVPGFWLPKHIEIVRYYTLEKLSDKRTVIKNAFGKPEIKWYRCKSFDLSVSSIEINKKFTSSDFSIRLPPKTVLWDKLSDTTVTIGNPLDSLSMEIKSYRKKE